MLKEALSVLSAIWPDRSYNRFFWYSFQFDGQEYDVEVNSIPEKKSYSIEIYRVGEDTALFGVRLSIQLMKFIVR